MAEDLPTYDLSKYSDAELEASLAPQLTETQDIMKGTSAGLARGVAQVAGAPGSMADLGLWTTGTVADKVGLPGVAGAMETARGAIQPGTAEGLTKWGEKYFPGMTYEPISPVAKGMKNAAEWVAPIGTAALGGGGWPAVARGATAALGSEALGDIAHEWAPNAEKAARLLGGLGGYRAASRLGGGHVGSTASVPEESKATTMMANALAAGAGFLGTKYFQPQGEAALIAALYGLQHGGDIPRVIKGGLGAARNAGIQEFKADPFGSSALLGTEAIPAAAGLIPKPKKTE